MCWGLGSLLPSAGPREDSPAVRGKCREATKGDGPRKGRAAPVAGAGAGSPSLQEGRTLKKSKETDLGHDSIGRLLFRLAVPAVTAQLVNMLYNIVDRMYIGHIEGIGAAALTGVGVTFPIIMIISAFSALIGMGGAPRASIKMGQGDYDGAEETLGNCFIVLVGISVMLTAVFLAFRRPLLLMFGASEATLPYADEYLAIYVCGTIFVQISLGMNYFISSQGYATAGMLTVLIGAVTNIVLDPIFIFTFGMGVRGAALATVISQAVSAVWVMIFLIRKSRLRVRPKYFRVRKNIILPALALGVSPFIMQSTESLLNIAFNSSLQTYGGDLAVGAMTILSSLMQILNMPLMGITQGAQPIISFNYGAQNTDRVRKAFKLCILCTVGYSTLFWLLAMLIPGTLVSIFNSDPELMNITVWAMRIYFATVLLMGLQTGCQQTFIAIGQAKSSLFLALLRKIILLIPLIYILPNFFTDKVFAVFLAEPISDTIAVLCTVSLFAYQFRKILSQMEARKKEPTPPSAA